MTATAAQLETLFPTLPNLLHDLQQAKFDIGLDSYRAVYALLLRLAALGKLSGDFAELRTYLAPVLCSSPQQQDEFNQHFDRWLAVSQPSASTANDPAPATHQAAHTPEKSAWLLLALTIVLLLPALFGLVWLNSLTAQPVPVGSTRVEIIPISAVVSAPVATSSVNQPVRPQTVQPPKAPQENQAPLNPARPIFYVTLALFLALSLWAVYDALWKPRFLKRHTTRQSPDLEKIFPQLTAKKLFSSVAFAHTAQQLHRHRDSDLQHLNLEATVRASIAAQGFFTPVYQARKTVPEYLVLIDRASFKDQHSQFVDALLQELDDYGLFIERYYFDRDPRRCYAARTPTVPCRLETLQIHHANHRLLIFADARHFFDPLGKPAPWLSQFSDWQNPCLFTPHAHWDYYKHHLAQAGFALLATGQNGLTELVNHLAASGVQKSRDDTDDNYPSLLQQRPLRFLERHAPAADTITQLRQQLQTYLGEDGLAWLAACAVYPELHWRLTLYLAPARTDDTINESLLLKLTRLPWLRHSYLPDWLRLALLQNLPPASENRIRQQLNHLLTNLQPDTGTGFALNIARWRGVFSFKHDHPLQDHVFLSFMNGRLAVKAHFSQRVRHPLALASAAAMVVVAGWFAFFAPQSKPPVSIPPVETKPEVAAASTVPPALVAPPQASEVPLVSPVVAAPVIPDKTVTPTPASDVPSGVVSTVIPPAVPTPVPTSSVPSSVSIEMVTIPSGSFNMGSNDGDGDEKPVHRVKVGRFELGKTEVTVGQFRAFVEATNYRTDAEKEGSCWSYNDKGSWESVSGNSWRKLGFAQSDQHPVACVSWNDAQAFVAWLNSNTAKKGYRLPSESEWEYAARAGTTTQRYWGDDPDQACAYANVADETAKAKVPGASGWTIHNCTDGYAYAAPVGHYKPNTYGLHDMLGNVWEWVQDSKHDSYNGAPSDGSAWEGSRAEARVLRGGLWVNYPQYVRAANRYNYTATYRNNNIGFRLARTLP